jgi:regulator of protease activity HflC (stomatin/prohibitin superfamily)
MSTDSSSSSSTYVSPSELLNSTKNEKRDDYELHERDVLPEIDQTDLDSVIIKSVISTLPLDQQTESIVTQFNRDVKDKAIVKTVACWRGQRIDRDDFFLAHRNNVAEIAPYSDYKLAIAYTMLFSTNVTQQLGIVKQNSLFFGAHGSYCVNVPQGKYAKVWSGNIPKILGSGYHVIHDINFKFRGEADLVDISAQQIQHGTIHILRVPVGQIAKVWVGTTPYLIYARADGRPYVVNNPLFRFDAFCSQTDQYISHGTIHILRIPAGFCQKIWIGTEPQILDSRKDPYEFHSPFFKLVGGDYVSQLDPYIRHGNLHRLRIPVGKIAKIWVGTQAELLQSSPDTYHYNSPYFRLEPRAGQQHIDSKSADVLFEDAMSSYISHGTINILRVPSGKVAKIWVSSQAQLLESRQEPYVFNSPYFRLEALPDRTLFEDATSKAIVHGSLKRIMPQTGEVGILYINGKLQVIRPSNDAKPVVIDNETAFVDGFISTGIQTLIFPSDATKIERRKENSKVTDDEINYEVFTTKDSLRVGVKLLVAYTIADPEKALSLLRKDGIIRHIENCATVDMGKAIQQCSSKEFLSSSQNRPTNNNEKDFLGSNAAPLLQFFQDTVKTALFKDLSDYGINLVRLNFETPKILDVGIAKQMAEQALTIASVSARESVLEQNNKIARTVAEQEAAVKSIAQQQENNNKISSAKAELEAAQLRGQAKLAEAKLNGESLVAEAEARNKAAQLVGAQYNTHPALFSLEALRIQTEALSKANLHLIAAPADVQKWLSPQLASGASMPILFGVDGSNNELKVMPPSNVPNLGFSRQ